MYVFKYNNSNVFMINYCCYVIYNFLEKYFQVKRSKLRPFLNNSRHIKERTRKMNF